MDKKKLVRMFSAGDQDGSGNISQSEMKKLLKKNDLYPGDEFFSSVFKCIDKDGSGEIDFDEFCNGISLIEARKKIIENNMEELKMLFEEADSDYSGNIDKGEMKKILKKLNVYPGDKEYESVYREIDTDGSGEIGFEEFIMAMAKLHVSFPKKNFQGGSKDSPALNDLRKLFNESDRDGTGNIDKKEMEKLLRKMNLYPGEKEFLNQFRLADCDGSGELDFDEFVKVLKIFQENEELRKKFRKLDVDGNGVLDFNEIKLGFKAMNYPITDQAIRDMIAVASSDGDNEVSFEGFTF